jgi:transposase-like protein
MSRQESSVGKVVTFKRPKPSEKHKGKILCKSGFHKWEVVKGNPFDVKSGKLVSRYRCSRCGASRTESR